MKPAIIIPAYNRPHTLRRLLTSLLASDIPRPTPLVIAIDRPPGTLPDAGHQAVMALADELVWSFGEKRIIRHETHRGLRANVAFCGDLSAHYGAIILLEDDLYVSPHFYRFAAAALDYYAPDPRIAAVALNSMWLNGFTLQPFVPLIDGLDVFFLQLATPQGQAYTAEQWSRAAAWLEQYPQPSLARLHPLLGQLPASDWLPAADAYLVETNAYFVYPRQSLTTNFGDRGTHIRHNTPIFQVPLQLAPRDHCLGSLDESLAVYDAFYECLPDRLRRLAPALVGQEFEVDLYATKGISHLMTDHVLTSRPARRSLLSFGKEMWPMEMNVIAGVVGDEIVLARRDDTDLSPAAAKEVQRRNARYFNRLGPKRRRDRIAARLRGRS